MKKKKANQMFKTFPLNEVFSDRVYVDVNNDVIYDKKMGVAIAYIHMTHTHMEIFFVLPDIIDDNFEDIRVYLKDYFNMNNVEIRPISEYYFHVSNGYVYLGHPCKDTNYGIRLPRLFDPADEEDAPETGSAAIEVVDEEDDYFDPFFNAGELSADVDAMIDRLID